MPKQNSEQKFLDDQKKQWQDTFSEIPEMFGSEASHPAYKAAADKAHPQTCRTEFLYGP